MAAPQHALVGLPLGRGLAQGVDARLVAPGSVGEADNVLVDRAGRYTKRPGWGLLPRTEETGLTLASPDRIDVAGRELLQVDTDGGRLWSWGPGRGRWESVGSLPEFRAERAPMIRTSQALTGGGLLRFGAGGRYELPWWQHAFSGGGGSLETYYRIRDTETGAAISRDTKLYPSALLTTPVGCTVGDSAWLAYGGGPLTVSGLDGTLGGISSAISVGNVLAFDCCSLGTKGLLAYAEIASTSLIVETRLEDITSDASATLTLPGPADEVAVCAGQGGQVWVAAIVQVAGSRDILLWRLSSALAVVAGPITVETRIPDPDYLQIGVNAAGDCFVTYTNDTGLFTRYEDSLHVRCVLAATNTLESWRKTMWRVFPASALYATDEGLYLAVTADGTGPFSTPTGSFSLPFTTLHTALIRVDNTYTSEPPSFAGYVAVNTAAAALTVRQRWVETKAGYRIAIVATTEAVGDDLQGLDVIDLEALGRRTARSLSLAQQAPVWSLCGLWGFDGYDAHDVGILQPPALTFNSLTGYTSGAAPNFAVGDYVYVARYEAIDDRGVVHVSPFSGPMVLAVPASTTAITVGIRNTQLTRHGRLAGYRRLSVALYRTDVNGAAAGVVRYYRLTELGDENLLFSTADESITYTDSLLDATAAGLGVWTTAGRLAPQPPPPARDVLACKARLWLVPADALREVWFSQQILADEVPWFNAGLSLQLLDTEEQIEALAALDDRVILFTRSRIYVVEGDGPLDTGIGSFLGPNLISSAFGCIERRSVISTSRGVYFLAACGLCLLDRGLSVQVVGDPVRDLIEGADLEAAVYDEAQARVVWLRRYGEGLSSLVIYDERHSVWTTASSLELDQIRGLAWDRGRSALVLAYSGGVAQEGYGAAPGYDGDGADPTWFGTTLATPWIRSGEPGSWAQVAMVHLEGEVCGPSVATLTAYRDYSETADGSYTIDTTTATRGERIVRQVGLPRQTLSALRLVLAEEAPTSLPTDQAAPHGSRWWGLTMLAAAQPGLARISPDLQGGLKLWLSALCSEQAWARAWAPSSAAPSARAWGWASAGRWGAPSTAPSKTPRRRASPSSTRRSTTPAATTRSARTRKRERRRPISARASPPTGRWPTRIAPSPSMRGPGRWAWPTTSRPTSGASASASPSSSVARGSCGPRTRRRTSPQAPEEAQAPSSRPSRWPSSSRWPGCFRATERPRCFAPRRKPPRAASSPGSWARPGGRTCRCAVSRRIRADSTSTRSIGTATRTTRVSASTKTFDCAESRGRPRCGRRKGRPRSGPSRPPSATRPPPSSRSSRTRRTWSQAWPAAALA